MGLYERIFGPKHKSQLIASIGETRIGTVVRLWVWVGVGLVKWQKSTGVICGLDGGKVYIVEVGADGVVQNTRHAEFQKEGENFWHHISSTDIN